MNTEIKEAKIGTTPCDDCTGDCEFSTHEECKKWQCINAYNPKVYNKKEKNYPSDAVYIGRGSPYGNPFVVGKDGDRDQVCDKYEAIIEADPIRKSRIIEALRGKDLVCWCAPLRCHGDYLLRISND